MSEHAAYNRIEAARAARRFPMILELIAEAAVNLTTVRLLAPHLTAENHRDVLESARHKSKREIDVVVASLSPQPDVASAMRKLPAPKTLGKGEPVPEYPLTSSTIAAPAAAAPVAPAATGRLETRPAEIKPLAPERYKIQFTVSRHTYEKLRRAQDLLRHTFPDGDPAAIFDRALTLLVSQLEQKKNSSDKPASEFADREGGITPHSRGGQAHRVAARRWPLRV